MARVEIRNVSKLFGTYKAVNDVSLTIEDGEFVVLLGPSGCGKSTLLRMVAGLELPTYGDIVIGDIVATRLRPKDRNIAMVFQNYALYPHLTLYENIAFPLRVSGRRGPEVDQKVRWAAGLVGIEHLLARKPRQTSGGERQRTALARSLVRNPALFLLDEPLSNLDAKLRHSAREELRTFQERVGMTALYVTHDQVEAMGLGDRVVVMQGGRVRQVGTPEEIYLYPADTFVATFIGTPPMNLIDMPGEVLGVRPENLMPVAFFGQEAGLHRMTMLVSRIEFLGSDKLIYGALDDPYGQAKVIARLPSSVPADIAVGERTQFAVREHELRRFDPETGLARTSPFAQRASIVHHG